MEMSVTEVIFSFLGGLGIFLYGLKIMGDGLHISRRQATRYFKQIYIKSSIRCYCRYRCNYFNTK